VALILGIGAAAAAALGFWRLLRSKGEPTANLHLNEARRTVGVVNTISYAASILLDAISMRRAAQYNPVAAGIGAGVTLPARIGDRREDVDD
jgi:hypothetical protein